MAAQKRTYSRDPTLPRPKKPAKNVVDVLPRFPKAYRPPNGAQPPSKRGAASLEPAELQKLLGLVEGSEAPVRAAPEPFEQAFADWAWEHGVMPGGCLAGTATELREHFLRWCNLRGFEAPSVTVNYFSRALKALGCSRLGREKKFSDRRVFLMARGPATYFADWIGQNLPPEELKKVLAREWHPRKAAATEGETPEQGEI